MTPPSLDGLGATLAFWRELARAVLPRTLVLRATGRAWRVAAPDADPPFAPAAPSALPEPRVELDLDTLARAAARLVAPAERAGALVALLGACRDALGVRCVPALPDGPVGDTGLVVDLDPDRAGRIAGAAWPDGLRATLAVAAGDRLWQLDLGETLGLDASPRPAGTANELARRLRASSGAELAVVVDVDAGRVGMSAPVELADLAALAGPDATDAVRLVAHNALVHARAVAGRRPLGFALSRDGAPWGELWLWGGRLSAAAPAARAAAPLVLGCELAWVRRALGAVRGTNRSASTLVESLVPARLRYPVASEEWLALVRVRSATDGPRWVVATGGEHRLGVLWEGERWRAAVAPSGEILARSGDSRRPLDVVRRGAHAELRFGEADEATLAVHLGEPHPIGWGPLGSAAEGGLAAAVLPGSRGTVQLAEVAPRPAFEIDGKRHALDGGRALSLATTGLRWRALLEGRETRLLAVFAGPGAAWSAIAIVLAPRGPSFAARSAPERVEHAWGDPAALPAIASGPDGVLRLQLPAGCAIGDVAAVASPLDSRGWFSARLRISVAHAEPVAGAGSFGAIALVHPIDVRGAPGEPAWEDHVLPLEVERTPTGLRATYAGRELLALVVEPAAGSPVEPSG